MSESDGCTSSQQICSPDDFIGAIVALIVMRQTREATDPEIRVPILPNMKWPSHLTIPNPQYRGPGCVTTQCGKQSMVILRTHMRPSGEIVTFRYLEGESRIDPAVGVPDHEGLMQAHIRHAAECLALGGTEWGSRRSSMYNIQRLAGYGRALVPLAEADPQLRIESRRIAFLRGRYMKKLRYYSEAAGSYITEVLSELTWEPVA